MAKLAINVRDVTALLGLEEHGLHFDASLTPVLRLAAGQDVLFRLAGGTGEYAAVGRLATMEEGDDVVVARFETIRSLDRQAQFWSPHADSLSIGVVDDATFEDILRAERSATQQRSEEIAARFVGEDENAPSLETFAAIAQTVLREASYRCAVTGAALSAETAKGPQVFVLRPREVGGSAHVNNCLALSPAAFAAFEAGHLTASDDFSLLADLRHIDPELLEAINPLGRLTVSGNPALQPATENLAYHRRMVFRLG